MCIRQSETLKFISSYYLAVTVLPLSSASFSSLLNSFLVAGLKTRTTKTFFNLVKKIPAVKRKIDIELGKARHGILAGMNKGSEGSQYVQNLPRKGLTEVILILEKLVSKASKHTYCFINICICGCGDDSEGFVNSFASSLTLSLPRKWHNSSSFCPIISILKCHLILCFGASI